jgi:hypothetical protein
MKIGELIEQIREKEYNKAQIVKERAAVITARFEDIRIGANATTAEIQAIHDDFNRNKTTEVARLNAEIDVLIGDIIDGRNQINRRNVELGVSRKLTAIKHLRMELSDLDKHINHDRYDRLDADVVQATGIRDRVRQLEKEKRALESEIRVSNYSNDI